MTTTLSLEPLLLALPSTSSSNGELQDDPAFKPEIEAVETNDQSSLAARLQRLWQERGDFSKLSLKKLTLEEEQEQDSKDADGNVIEKADQARDDDEQVDNSEDSNAEGEESMTQEQLWELKLGILQGLDLARSDVTSALDLLQLLLNPLNALTPAVPEEALALPSGSMSSSLLHTPLPAPAEGLHLRNTALAFATKAKAIDTASELLRNASKRLERTTNKSQSEWTDLLRLKRSGQWKIEARPAMVPYQAGPSSAAFLPNIPVDKMAKDLCIFCGIEEAEYRWRQAGLVRLDNASEIGKGKGKQKLNIPERLEGRRRMCMSLSIDGVTTEEIAFSPPVSVPDEDDLHAILLQVQQELFEEEIFAEFIREAREQPYGITATRNAIEVRHPGAFGLTIKMTDVVTLEEARELYSTSSEAVLAFLPQLLLSIARLQMVEIYRTRRDSARTRKISGNSSIGKSGSTGITNTLRSFLLYCRHTYLLKSLLGSCLDALKSSTVFGDDIELDFAAAVSGPEEITKFITSTNQALEGTACLMMGSQSLNISFAGASAVTIHLPTRSIYLQNMNDFIVILKRILKAAILKDLEGTLKTILADVAEATDWEVVPTAKAVGKSTPVLARKKPRSSAGSNEDVEAYVSVLPTVSISPSQPYEAEITFETTLSSRRSKLGNRKTFRSDMKEEFALEAWLKSELTKL